MLCIEGKLKSPEAISGGIVSTGLIGATLKSKTGIRATLKADIASVTMASPLVIQADMSAMVTEAHLISDGCVVGELTSHDRISASLTHGGAISGSLQSNEGIRPTFHPDIASVSLAPDCIEATLTCVPVNAYFAFACPIDDIKSCFSLGGWYNDLGWDNNLGWKN